MANYAGAGWNATSSRYNRSVIVRTQEAHCRTPETPQSVVMKENLRENLLLAALPASLRHAVVPELHPVYLRRQTVLNKDGINEVYFPLSCVISVVTETSEGDSIQNLLIGYEGALTFAGTFGTRAVVQIEGEALRMPRPAYMRFMQDSDFLEAVESYRDAMLALAGRAAVCQAFHATEQRLAYWLAAIRDRVMSDDLLLTQEYLATVLGVRRPTVTIAAGILQSAGFISYRYGRVTVVDLDGLRDSACECYAATAAQLRRRSDNQAPL